MNSVSFRRARSDEAEQLTNLARASKRYWGYSETLIELWREDLEFTAESICSHTVTVAEQAGQLVGVSAFSLSRATAELEDLWVHPSCIGQGLGTALFHEVVAQARTKGAASLVIEADPNAEKFYQRLGASPVGSVPSKPEGRRLPRLVYPLGGKAAA